MKKFVMASALTLASIGLTAAPTLYAQNAPSSDQITIKDPAEFSAYQNATTQTDPKAKASAIEGFLQAYPQSVVKKSMLDSLVDAYSQFDLGKAADAAGRMLQMDPANLKAIFISVYAKNAQAKQATGAQQAQLLDDAADLAKKGLGAPKPEGLSDADFTTLKSRTYPLFHEVIADDAVSSKKDYAAAITEYRAVLESTPEDQTKTGSALNDTLKLGQAYTQLNPKDILNAVWFLARAENFAPANYQGEIDKQARYWYRKFHGSEDGFDAIKTKAATTVFPPADYTIAPAPKPQDVIHQSLAGITDLSTLALADKVNVLSNGYKEDADKVWATLAGKTTLLPGIVAAATTTQIQLEVTDDAKSAKQADFTINLKTPLADKDVPAVGAEIKNLAATFDSYTQNPAQITMKDGEFQEEKKAPVHHKPSAGHHN